MKIIDKYLAEKDQLHEGIDYYQKLKNVKDQKILISVLDKIVDDKTIKKIMREDIYDNTIKDLKSLIDLIPAYIKKWKN